MPMMMKRPLANFGFLLFSLFLTVGCSASREVSVVSHGDEEVAVEDPASESAPVVAPAPPVVVSDVPQLNQQKEEPPSPVAPIVKPISPPPPVVPPPIKDSVGKDISGQSAEDSTLPWTLQDVFFDFDQMVIRRDAIPILEQNAKVIRKRYANREVLIQGHCDERGTEAYNLILGERRAAAVKNYLVNLGVQASQLRVLSLGKSQPFCPHRTVSCFRQNRRAHFVLK